LRTLLILIVSVVKQSTYNTSLFELIGIESEIKLAESDMADWAAPRHVKKNLNSALDDVYIKPEPLGVVLIIGTFNYPWAMILQPLVGAIAAGTRIYSYYSLSQHETLCSVVLLPQCKPLTKKQKKMLSET